MESTAGGGESGDFLARVERYITRELVGGKSGDFLARASFLLARASFLAGERTSCALALVRSGRKIREERVWGGGDGERDGMT
jgi:hypothetical protein